MEAMLKILARPVMQGYVCPLYFAADEGIYYVGLNKSNLNNISYNEPELWNTIEGEG